MRQYVDHLMLRGFRRRTPASRRAASSRSCSTTSKRPSFTRTALAVDDVLRISLVDRHLSVPAMRDARGQWAQGARAVRPALKRCSRETGPVGPTGGGPARSPIIPRLGQGSQRWRDSCFTTEQTRDAGRRRRADYRERRSVRLRSCGACFLGSTSASRRAGRVAAPERGRKPGGRPCSPSFASHLWTPGPTSRP